MSSMGYLKLNSSGAVWSEPVFSQCLNRGHKGRVNSVGASIGTDYIISGGEDSTTRVWRYNDDSAKGTVSLNTFTLRAIVTHQKDGQLRRFISDVPVTSSCASSCALPCAHSGETNGRKEGVTAVACAGVKGPFVSGCACGDVVMLSLCHGLLPTDAWHLDAVNHICIVPIQDVDEDMGPWYMATASDDCTAMLFEICGESEGARTKLHTFHHTLPVMAIEYVRGGEDTMANRGFATATSAGVHLWSFHNGPEMKRTLLIPGYDEISSFSATDKPEGTLILASHQGFVAVWAMVDGDIVHKLGNKCEDGESNIAPLVVYEGKGDGIAVDTCGKFAKYGVGCHDGSSCSVWQMLAVTPDQLAEPPSSWWSLLTKSGSEEVVVKVKDKTTVTDFKITEDGRDGQVLITCNTAGHVTTWSLVGDDGGEVCADLRSLSYMEIIVPPCLVLVTFLQISSCAFGRGIPWPHLLQSRVMKMEEFAMIDIDTFKFPFPKSILWRYEAFSLIAIMVSFLFIQVFGIYEYLPFLSRRLHMWRTFIRENSQKGHWWGIGHITKLLLDGATTGIWCFIFCLSTVMVAPMCKMAARILDCERNEEGHYVLRMTPEVKCLEDDHWYIGLAILLLFPPYLFGLMPYALVTGDAKYVQRSELFSWAGWEKNAKRKATKVHQGPWHPNPEHVTKILSVEFLTKAAIPIISVLTSRMPRLMMALMSATSFVICVTAEMGPLAANKQYSRVQKSLRYLILCVMISGLAATFEDTMSISYAAIWVMGPTATCIFSYLCIGLWKEGSEDEMREVLVFTDVQHLRENSGLVKEEADQIRTIHFDGV